MSYAAKFNILPSRWQTIGRSTEGTGTTTHSDARIRLRLEPWIGDSQALLIWELKTAPNRFVRNAIFRAIKEEAFGEFSWKEHQRPPTINFKAIVTDLYYSDADGEFDDWVDILVHRAFNNIFQQDIAIPSTMPNNLNVWEPKDVRTYDEAKFEVIATARSAILQPNIGQGYCTDFGDSAEITIYFEPYQGDSDFLCTSDLSPQELSTDYKDAVCENLRKFALEERPSYGILTNVKATIVNAVIHNVRPHSQVFYYTVNKACENAIALDNIINLE